MRRNNSINDNNEIDGTCRFKDFFLEQYKDQIHKMIKSKNKDMFHSLHFSYMELLDYDIKLADFLMTNPDRALEWAHSGVFQAQEQLFNKQRPHFKQKQLNNTIDDEPLTSVKLKCKARISGQLLFEDKTRPTVSAIRSKDVSKIIQIRGTVIRQSKAKLLESSRKFSCLVCNYQFVVRADITNEKDIEFPKQCRNRDCKSKKFESMPDSTEAIDFQEIHLQEQIQKIGLGKIPRSIRVVLTCDLSDSCQPGDDIEIIGIVRYHWSSINTKKSDSRFDIQMYIEAMSLSKTNVIGIPGHNDIHVDQNYRSIFDNFWINNGSLTPTRARNMILANLCPQLCGMYIIKLAVALTIIGGIPREEYGTRIRGQSHLLLVGDPGTGKSQILRYAARMSNRSVLTTGVGTTSAGLTVSAVRDGGEWVLEAGALVLADGGICCIDEFGSVREHDRGVIHEAMEQQTISVAKGGFVCSLNSRTTVLAAMNPPSGGFDEDSDLALNTNMATSLLSRFDVILLLLDQKNDEWDRKVGQHLMDNLCEPEFPTIDYLYDCNDDIDTQQTLYDSNICNSNSNTPMSDNHNNKNKNNICFIPHQPEWNSTAAFERDMARFDEMREERVHWTIDQMQAYFTLIRNKEVIFTDEAQKILTEYYALQRRKEMRDKSRTTIRLLESLIRLAQAHCRLMYREQVLPLDAIQAVYLMEKSLCTTNSISDYSVLQTIFPRDAEESYKAEREVILSTLFPREWHHNKCEDLNDIEFDYKEDIKQREIRELEKMESDILDDDDFFIDDDDDNNNYNQKKELKDVFDNNDNNYFDGSVNSSLYAKNNNNKDINKNINKNINSQISSVSNTINNNNEFVKPVQSLREKMRNLSQNVENNLSQRQRDGSDSVSPLDAKRNKNNNNNNGNDNDSPPGFGRRRKRTSLINDNNNNNNNGIDILNTPIQHAAATTTMDKQGELSNYITPTTYSDNEKADWNGRMPTGSLQTVETQNRNEGQIRNNKKRKRDEIINENEIENDNMENVNKKRKLNDNNMYSQTTVNSSRLSVNEGNNNNENENQENQSELSNICKSKENKKQSNIVLGAMMDDTESTNDNISNISSWDNTLTQENDGLMFNFDDDYGFNNNKKQNDSQAKPKKKRPKKKFF